MRLINKFYNMCKENKLFKFILVYGIFYIIVFFWLENRNVEINIIHSRWDSLIPFCEYFIIPYFSWFIYIAFTLIYFLFLCKENEESKRFIASFCIGMTVFLGISYIYPNGHNLRTEVVGDGFLIQAMKFLHWIDTPTNVLPSMHVFVTVACSIALLRQEALCSHKGFKHFIWLWSILIILSTLFLKQHSVVDVIWALVLNILCYICIYKLAEKREIGIAKFKKKKFT